MNWDSFIESWEKSADAQDVLLCEDNVVVLKNCLQDAVVRGIQPSATAWKSVVDTARRSGLKMTQRPEPEVKHEDSLPYANEPKLRNLRTVEDFKELTTEQTRVFTQPAAFETYGKGESLNAKFNARYAYVVQNKIHRTPKTESAEPKPFSKDKTPKVVIMLTPEEQTLAKEQAAYDQANIDEANALIRNYTSYNHGKTAGGRMILTDVRDAAIKAGKSSKEVLDAVRAKWKTLP